MNRKALKAAVFGTIAPLQFDLGAGPVGFTTASPKLRHWNDVQASLQPAFFLSQGAQVVMEPKANGLPRTWLLDYIAYIYVNTAGETDPADALNPILDAIDAAFAPQNGMVQTLGGLCQWARIEGKIETFEGTLGDQEVALVPIRLLVA